MIGRTISHYKIVDKLGEGGMGAVYKAEDTTLQRLVALKALSTQLAQNEEARARFVREAQAASALNHANITTVYELLEEEGEQFIAMEYVEGKTIRDIIESGHVSIRKALDIIIQAAEALEAAHNKGILHRDVKSANIMVSMEGNVKVMDFGLAHLEERSQLTRTGTTMGTLAYSSPEQLIGRPVDRKSEVFSLGCVFYELLTGQLPFRSPSEGELVFAIINNEQDRPSKLREDVPEKVDAVVTRMLEKKPELRYPSCGELLSDLKAIRGELETTTVQFSGATEMLRGRARGRTIALAGTAVIAGLIALYLLVLAPRAEEPPYLAILPFTDVNQPGEVGFASAIAYDAFERLCGIEGLQLKHMGSTAHYTGSEMSLQEIGRDLGAEFLLAATCQWFSRTDGMTVQVRPELIRVADAAAIWTTSFTEEFSETLSLSTNLAQRIAGAVIEKIAPLQPGLSERGTDDDEAWRFYLSGNEYEVRKFNVESARNARQMYEKAAELDSTFVEAWLALESICLFGRYQHSLNWVAEAELSRNRVLHLASGSPEAHLAQGYWYYRAETDYDKALTEFEQVLHQKPDDPAARAYVGYVRRRQGAWREAEECILSVLKSDPWDWENNFALAQIYLWTRNYPEAERYYERAIFILPDVWQPYSEKALLYLLWEGDREKARVVLDDAPMPVIETIITWNNPRQRLIVRILPDFYEDYRDRIAAPSRMENWCNRADAAVGTNHVEIAKVYFDSMRVYMDEYLRNPVRTDDQRGYYSSQMALWCAGSGIHDDAMQYIEQALEIHPYLNDAHSKWRVYQEITEAYVLAGEYELAIDQLEYLLSIPALVSVPLLRIDPIWNPLRELPRFQALLRKYN